MPSSRIGPYDFSIMPETAAWAYSMNIKTIDTYGGRVVQLLSCSIDSLSVEGYIRPKRTGVMVPNPPYPGYDIDQWQGMREFEYNVRQIMAYHEQSKDSVHFSFPDVGWDGEVFLTGYSDVRYEPDIPAVRYKLSFDIDSGFDDVLESATEQGLDNIPDGVGWVRSIYNTPNVGDWENAKKAVEKVVDDAGSFTASKPLDFYQYLMEVEDEGEKLDMDDIVDTVVNALSSAASQALSADDQYLADGIAAVATAGVVVAGKTALELLGLTCDWDKK